MKKSLLTLAVLAPLSLGQALANDASRGSIYRPMETVKPAAVAPEMDAAAGALAVALVGGGIALFRRARRKRDA